ncbi:MAG: hypothetical protein H6650_05670 [Ardenticatenales bacterium]|nr:hypothetical protein [Ardenticatenales bacterium]
MEAFNGYGLCFDISDDKASDFQLEASQLEYPQFISRLCHLLVTATLYLVRTGTALVELVETNRRHLGDTH